MIHQVTMFAVRCDGCGNEFIEPETDFCAFTDECSARTAAMNAGWYEISGKHYCPHCVEYDEEADEYKPKE